MNSQKSKYTFSVNARPCQEDIKNSTCIQKQSSIRKNFSIC